MGCQYFTTHGWLSYCCRARSGSDTMARQQTSAFSLCSMVSRVTVSTGATLSGRRFIMRSETLSAPCAEAVDISKSAPAVACAQHSTEREGLRNTFENHGRARFIRYNPVQERYIMC